MPSAYEVIWLCIILSGFLAALLVIAAVEDACLWLLERRRRREGR